MINKWKNQADLYLELKDILATITFIPEYATPDKYDLQQFVRIITEEEGIDLLIRKPDIDRSYFVQAVRSLGRGLQDLDLLKTIFKLTPHETEQYMIRFEDDFIVQFYLRNLDFYLFEALGETAQMRHSRIDDFLMDFIQCYPIRTAVPEGNHTFVQDVIYQVLRQVSEDNYLLSNRDMAILIEWLIKAYNDKQHLFTSKKSTKYFYVPLESRSVKIKNLNYYSRER